MRKKVYVQSAIDVFAGAVLLLNLNAILNYVGALILLKGLFELVISLRWRNWWRFGGVYTNVIDIVAGIVAFVVALGIQALVFTALALLVIAKGIYPFFKQENIADKIESKLKKNKFLKKTR